MIVAVALMALPAMAQTFGAQQEEQPNAVFQSTSTMSGSGSSYSANPTLNSDGTATYSAPSYAPGGKPYKSPPSVDPGDTPGTETRPDDPNPLGDAVLPLLFMSLAFCGYVYFRRKRSEA